MFPPAEAFWPRPHVGQFGLVPPQQPPLAAGAASGAAAEGAPEAAVEGAPGVCLAAKAARRPLS